MPVTTSTSPLSKKPIEDTTSFWPQGWWRIMEFRIGIIPLPIYVIIAALLAGFVMTGTVPGELSMMIALLAIFGFTCAELGKRIPIVRDVGGAAIFATFIPSYLVFHKFLPDPIVKVITKEFTLSILYLFIAAIIVGSILSMDRQVLIKGFLKIFVPIAAGSVAAALVGTGVGTLLGLGASHAFYYIVIPIMAGGVGEGALPLSVGYSGILHQPQGDLFAQVLPPVMLGSLTAILLSGMLNYVGKKYPHLTGEGRLQPGEHDDMDPHKEEITGHMDVTHIAAAGITAVTLYLVGLLALTYLKWPAPVVMLFIAVIIKLTQAISPKLQEGAFVVYKFFSTAVTYPLLFAVGVALTPWDKLIAAFTIANVITIVATVVTSTATGFFVGRWVNMYPIETAIISACRCSQGGTGDIAILTAADRMVLMPFAQIATRIGGAITVTLALIALSQFA